MLFQSPAFLIFFAALYLMYLPLPLRWQNLLLVGGSLLFYGYSDWRLAILLAVSTLATYGASLAIAGASTASIRKKCLWAGLAFHVSILAYFKWAPLIPHGAPPAFGRLGLKLEPGAALVAMPLGVSFYTLQAIGYLADVYWGKVKVARDLVELSLFKVFFPQLLAGPIERAGSMIPQIRRRRVISSADLGEGTYLFAWGFFKKVFVADGVVRIVNSVFASQPGLNGLETLIGVYSLAIYIYADFSGYTDMARGIARLLGFKLSTNFDLPLLASSPVDFWRRWHISLSTWFRDYIYYPLFFKTKNIYLAVVASFFLNSLWHGATWNFVILGFFWGIVISACIWAAPWLRRQVGPLKQLRIAGSILTFHVVTASMVFLRSRSLGQVCEVFGSLTGRYELTPLASARLLQLAFYAAPLLATELWQYRASDSKIFLKASGLFRFSALVAAAYLILLSYLFGDHPPLAASEFVYFRF